MKKAVVISLVFLFLICIFVSAAAAADVVDSGVCDDGLSWTLDDEGTLTVEGAGPMKDYLVGYYTGSYVERVYPPWYTHREEIQSVVVGAGITRIGNQAFADCTAFTGLTIPDTVSEIGAAAFSHCRALPEVVIPNSVTTIEKGAFSYCSSLAVVTLSEQLQGIGEYAFGNCVNLESVGDLPEGISVLEPGVFSSCEKLTNIGLPSGLVSIGNRAFISCISLQNLDLPASLTTIEDEAFFHCMGLTEITVPAAITQIGRVVFGSCQSLETVTFESGLKQIGTGMFQGSAVVDPIIPSSVETIGAEAFADCQNIKNVVLPEGVKTVADKAFYAMNIENISLPNSLISIGKDAFFGKFRSVHIPAGVRFLGTHAFDSTLFREFTVAEENNYYCSDDGILYNKNKTTIIQYPRFKSSGVASFTVPDGVKSIGDYAFGNCYIGAFVLPETLREIGNCSFYNCDSVRTISVPDGVVSVDNEAFFLCDILSSMRLPASLSTIGQNVLRSCPAFSSVEYAGARCQWNRISIAEENSVLTNAALTVASEHVPALETTETVPATCTSAGERVITERCSVCNTFIGSTTEELPMLPHSLVRHEGKAPTSTEPGWEPYETCENCDYTTYTEIPPLTPDPYESLEFLFENGILTVSGSGTVPTVSNTETAPFSAYAADCNAIVINEGVSAVAANAFAGLTQVNIVILNGPISFESNAFAANTGINTVICTAGVQLKENAFSSESEICFYEPKERPHTGSAAGNINVIPYSFTDDTLIFEGSVVSDTYGLLDLMAVMSGRYDPIRFVQFTSYTSLDVPFYVFSKTEGSYVLAEDNTLEGVRFSVKVPGEKDWETITFNEFCALADTQELSRFRLVADIETGEEVQDNDFEIRDENPVVVVIKRVLKWITSLLNKLFSIFSKF